MPRTTPNEELQLIESIVAAFPKGMGIAAIEAQMEISQNAKLNRRTLQRRMQKLVEAKRLIVQGESTALVYKTGPVKAVELNGVAASVSMGVVETELYVALTPQSAGIRDQVRRSLMHRLPVGYRREFAAVAEVVHYHHVVARV
ncbi:MAG: hypothetical protein NTX67_03495 [Burkholderiales bacterium]|nr:hypothetical protein [Burkholderiales bacterium]